jgi:hypothetical protein
MTKYKDNESGIEKLRSDLEKLGFTLVRSRWAEEVETRSVNPGHFEAVRGGIYVADDDPEGLVKRAKGQAAKSDRRA